MRLINKWQKTLNECDVAHRKNKLLYYPRNNRFNLRKQELINKRFNDKNMFLITLSCKVTSATNFRRDELGLVIDEVHTFYFLDELLWE